MKKEREPHIVSKKLEVINELLGYEKLKIIQRPDMFNFSLDSMLVGYFAPLSKMDTQILDLGTGNAPIPLYLTLRTTAHIDAVEFQLDVFNLAHRSVALNNLEHQITVLNANIIGINKVVGHNKYDLVTCNPPYYEYYEGVNVPKSEYKKIARYEVELVFEDVVIEAKKVLKNKGIFFFSHLPERIEHIVNVLSKHKMYVKSIQFVHPRIDEDANHILICAQKGMKKGNIKVLKPIIVFENGEYSNVLRDLFFYKKGMI